MKKKHRPQQKPPMWTQVQESAGKLESLGLLTIQAVIGEVDGDGHARAPAMRVAVGPLVEQIAVKTGCTAIEVMQRLAYGLLEVRAGRMRDEEFIPFVTAPRGDDEQWVAISV